MSKIFVQISQFVCTDWGCYVQILVSAWKSLKFDSIKILPHSNNLYILILKENFI